LSVVPATSQDQPVRPRVVSRLAIVVVGAVVLLGLTAVPAAAHGGGPDAAYYRTQLTEVAPRPPGVSAGVDPAGDWIELTYTGPETVIVLGYLREPYLRVTASGVEENLLSQTTYLNQAMFAEIPTGMARTAAAPNWNSIARNGTARWHDHRIHWMGQGRPPVVAADPTHAHQVGTWAVHATVGSAPFEIRGTIDWRGRPGGLSATAWLILGLVNIPFFAGALALTRIRHRRRMPASSGVRSAPRLR
jgi:hypothetical protein